MPVRLSLVQAAAVCRQTPVVAASNMACQHAKVWKLPKTGNIGNMILAEQPVPTLSAGQVSVAVRAVGVNFADVFTCLGLYAAAPKEDVTPGLETASKGQPQFAGVVTSLGPKAESDEAKSGLARPTSAADLRVGDRVLGACRFGSYATHLNVSAQQVLKVPQDWTFAQAAGYLVQSLTAYYGLKSLGNIKVNFLLDCFPALKPGQVIVRDSSQYPAQLQSALQAVERDGFDIVLDAVAGEFFRPSYEAMARGGRHVVFGAANWTPTGDRPGWLRLAWQYLNRTQIDPMQMIGDNKSVMGFNLIWMFDKVTELAELAQELVQLNLPAPHVGVTFSFEDAPAALRTFQSGKTVGKVVLEVTEGG